MSMENFDYAFRAAIKKAKTTKELDLACLSRIAQIAKSQPEPIRSVCLTLLKMLKDLLIN